MLAAEIYDGIILFEEIAITYCLVPEFVHILTFKTGEADFTLGENLCRGIAEQSYGGIGQTAFFSAKTEVVQFRLSAFQTRSLTGDATLIDS